MSRKALVDKSVMRPTALHYSSSSFRALYSSSAFLDLVGRWWSAVVEVVDGIAEQAGAIEGGYFACAGQG